MSEKTISRLKKILNELLLLAFYVGVALIISKAYVKAKKREYWEKGVKDTFEYLRNKEYETPIDKLI